MTLESWLSKDQLEISILNSKTAESFEEYSGNTFGMWIIENEDFREGGYVQSTQKYRLRHLSSGCYLQAVLDK